MSARRSGSASASITRTPRRRTGARLLTESDIGEDSIIAAGCVVPPGMIVPPRSLVMGIPGRVVRSVTPEEIERTRMTNERYRMLARRYAAGEYA